MDERLSKLASLGPDSALTKKRKRELKRRNTSIIERSSATGPFWYQGCPPDELTMVDFITVKERGIWDLKCHVMVSCYTAPHLRFYAISKPAKADPIHWAPQRGSAVFLPLHEQTVDFNILAVVTKEVFSDTHMGFGFYGAACRIESYDIVATLR